MSMQTAICEQLGIDNNNVDNSPNKTNFQITFAC